MGIQAVVRRALPLGLLVGLLLVACGGNEDDGGDDVQSAGSVAQSQIDSRTTEVIPGVDRVLVVDPETRQAEFAVATPDGTVAVESAPALPGRGPLINVTGAQTPSGSWVVAGTDCVSSEVADPAGCDPGTMTVAVLDGGSWRAVADQPQEFQRAFVAVDSSSENRALFRRWDRGSSDFWLFDVTTDAFERVAWSPAPLELMDPGVIAGEDLETASEPTRTSCLTGDRLVVIEGETQGGVVASRVMVVDVTDPAAAVLVSEADFQLTEAASQMPMVCADGHRPYLIALSARDGQAIAYEVSTQGPDIGPAMESSPSEGVVGAITYGHSGLAVERHTPSGQRSGGTTPIDPESGQPPTSAADGPAVDLVVFQDGEWVGPATGEVVTSGDEVVPMSEPELPLIAVDEGAGVTEYRAIERGSS
jgi:hypothetical protein